MNNNSKRDILADVKPEECFWIHNGSIIHNLHELANALEYMDKATFQHHVTKEKNDLADWIKDVIKDEKLAEELYKINSKEKTIKKIKKRIKYIESRVDKKRIKSLEGIEEYEPKKVQSSKKEGTFVLDKKSLFIGISIGICIGLLLAFIF